MKKRGRSKSSRKVSSSQKHKGLSDGAVIALFLIFVAIIIIVFGTDSQMTQKDQIKLLNTFVIETGEEGRSAIIVGNNLDRNMLLKLANEDYADLKALLEVTSDFVIHFEDENGNIVEVIDKPCIGSGNVKINGYTCGG